MTEEEKTVRIGPPWNLILSLISSQAKKQEIVRHADASVVSHHLRPPAETCQPEIATGGIPKKQPDATTGIRSYPCNIIPPLYSIPVVVN
jgi:hypothetical protein